VIVPQFVGSTSFEVQDNCAQILLGENVRRLISRTGYDKFGAYRIALRGRAVSFAFGLGAKLKPLK